MEQSPDGASQTIRPQTLPTARHDEVICEVVEGENVLYDMRRHRAHTLNATASAVWQWCDGKTSHADMVDRMAHHLDINEREAGIVLDLVLDRLSGVHLLEADTWTAQSSSVSRREALRRLKILGISVLLPVVYTLAAPSPASAASCVALSGSCESSSDCCLGLLCLPVGLLGAHICI